MPKKPKCWSHSEGEKGVTVTVYERRPGGLLYARAFDPARAGGKGGYVRRSLKHSDRERARTYALEQAAKLSQGHNELAEGKTTLARLFALYQTHRTPRKSPGDQGEDRRRAQMFARILGARKVGLALRLLANNTYLLRQVAAAYSGPVRSSHVWNPPGGDHLLERTVGVARFIRRLLQSDSFKRRAPAFFLQFRHTGLERCRLRICPATTQERGIVPPSLRQCFDSHTFVLGRRSVPLSEGCGLVHMPSSPTTAVAVSDPARRTTQRLLLQCFPALTSSNPSTIRPFCWLT